VRRFVENALIILRTHCKFTDNFPLLIGNVAPAIIILDSFFCYKIAVFHRNVSLHFDILVVNIEYRLLSKIPEGSFLKKGEAQSWRLGVNFFA
jgi:hypothetical protein